MRRLICAFSILAALGFYTSSSAFAQESKKTQKKTQSKTQTQTEPKTQAKEVSSSSFPSSSLTPAPTPAVQNTVINPALQGQTGIFGAVDILARRTFGDQGVTSLFNSVTMGYGLPKRYYLAFTGAFENHFTRYHERDRNWALSDSVVSFGNNRIYQSPKKTLSVFTSYSLVLPTSRVSQRASLRTGHSWSIGAFQRLGRWTLIGSNEISVYDYTKKTADVMGTQYNEVVSNWVRMNLAYAITNTLNFENRAGFYVGRNYAPTTVNIWRLQTGFAYQAYPGLFLTAQLRVQDRTITTNPFFDLDTRQAFFGASYWF